MLQKLNKYSYTWRSNQEKRVTGRFNLSFHYCPHQIVLQGFVTSVAIDDTKHRDKGHGTVMMKELIREARRLKVDELRLDVDRKNLPALRLYARAGFKKELHDPINQKHNYANWRLLLRVNQQGETTVETFVVGDVVQLKSGGPKMTVANVDERNRNNQQAQDVLCRFFDGQGELDKETFPAATLQKCVDKKPVPKKPRIKLVKET